MKKSIAVLFFLMISVSGLFAQRTTVKLNSLKEPSIIYTAKDVVVKFDKQDFLDMYAFMENGVWAGRNMREKEASTTAIEWLKKQKKPIQLDETMTDQSKPETSLAWLVQNVVGAPLMMKGQAEIYDVKAKRKKEVIEVIEETSELSGKSYAFYYSSQPKEFLKIWNVNEWEPMIVEMKEMEETATVEVMVDDVVIEEVVPVVEEVADDPNKVYTITEIQPEYPGGMDKWNEYVKKSLNYPKDAVKQQVEGTVFIQFVVQETGKLTDFQIIKGISLSCDKEALRLCKESINWKPGKQAGKTVKVRFVMPIKFKLADLEKK